MHQSQLETLVGGKVPVFVFPTSLAFYADDPSSHQQSIAVYNPYQFAVQFRVTATAPLKYVVSDAQGVIKPSCLVKIQIRHNAISPANYETTDAFRITILEPGDHNVLGKKHVPATLLAKKPAKISMVDADHFELLVPPQLPHASPKQYSIGARRAADGLGPSYIYVFAAVICIAIMMLPTAGIDQSSLPSYLHLSVNQKLGVSFALGLLAMAILRT